MQKITQVTEADIGRIAVSLDSSFRVKLLSLSENDFGNNHVEYLKDSLLVEDCVGEETYNFALIGGCEDMYWEDEMKTKKPKTKFEIWCDENGYDPKGEFVYNKDLSSESEISFKLDEKITIEADDNTSCPYFKGESGKASYEYFCEEGDSVLTQISKANPKPRFHKKRQKPPVRKKTDVVIKYKTGQSYTLKNVSSVSVVPIQIIIGLTKKIDDGIRLTMDQTIDLDLVKSVEIRTPTGKLSIMDFGDGEFLVDFPGGFSITRQWSQLF